eukprot:Gregarina_sp_Pseudo_9__189@NODE_1123_length_1860_cov_8_277320_g1050_i0_p1_GENE_NODE_1123_length_1860_cov_8_277320_g1050_i0NODE_1123_length_1860_cov_8_277320_g1050_i0_p1_ORF_typecomplete_len448_score149_10DNA_primase_lrg/PF04104_14/0_047DNA_primase_lrg/PF04104_14/2_7e02Plk4_PB2/PF18409_1/1e03Plk4_PB2/PF18409_1/1_3e04Plk4_PB2/PF18409_1/3_1e03Plk4_PB2/PF18409_1/0_7_NODE_1123_length_1860_cov_8_277320_g1050_i01011444
MECLEKGGSETAFDIPADRAALVRGCILDAVAANFKKLASTDNMKLFTEAADNRLSGETRNAYKTFFDRLVVRSSELKQTAPTPATFLGLEAPKAVSNLGQLSAAKDVQKHYKQRLEALNFIEKVNRTNSDMRRSKRQRLRRRAEKKEFAPFERFQTHAAELHTQLREALVAHRTQGAAFPVVEALPAWEPVANYISLCRKIKLNLDKAVRQFVPIHFASQAVIDTFKQDNVELQNNLAKAANRQWAPVLSQYIKGTLSQKMQDCIKTRKEIVNPAKDTVLAQLNASIPETNIYKKAVQKAKLLDENPNSKEYQESIEWIMNKDAEGLMWFLRNLDQFKTQDGWDFTQLRTVAIPKSSPYETAAPKTPATEEIETDAEYSNYMQTAIVGHMTKTIKELLKKSRVRVTDDKQVKQAVEHIKSCAQSCESPKQALTNLNIKNILAPASA